LIIHEYKSQVLCNRWREQPKLAQSLVSFEGFKFLKTLGQPLHN
jgi:hypothetical protein